MLVKSSKSLVSPAGGAARQRARFLLRRAAEDAAQNGDENARDDDEAHENEIVPLQEDVDPDHVAVGNAEGRKLVAQLLGASHEAPHGPRVVHRREREGKRSKDHREKEAYANEQYSHGFSPIPGLLRLTADKSLPLSR